MLSRNQSLVEETRPLEVGFYLVPGFAMIGFSAAVEPLRAANRLAGKTLYNWTILTRTGKSIQSGIGLGIEPDCSIANNKTAFDLMIICAGSLNTSELKPKPVMDWIRKLARRGCALGAVSTASEILANAGLLDGYRCTIHWENDESFRENHPKAILTGGIYEIDRNRLTAAGGIASLDMMLNWISRNNGDFFASAIAEQFIHDHLRTPTQSQRKAEMQLVQRNSPRLARAVELMHANTEDILSSQEIADQINISTRQLERLFTKYRQCSLHKFYLKIRLEKARHLILNTGMSMLQISIVTGFSSQSHFARAYRALFDKPPSRERDVW